MGLQAFPIDNVDPAMEKRCDIVPHSHIVIDRHAGGWVEVYENIDVAPGMGQTACGRAEDRRVANAFRTECGFGAAQNAKCLFEFHHIKLPEWQPVQKGDDRLAKRRKEKMEVSVARYLRTPPRSANP